MRLYACQAAAHLQRVDLQAGLQVLTTLSVELIPGDSSRHVNGDAADPNEGQQLLFSWAVHPNPEKAASASHYGPLAARERTCVPFDYSACSASSREHAHGCIPSYPTTERNQNVKVLYFVKSGRPPHPRGWQPQNVCPTPQTRRRIGSTRGLSWPRCVSFLMLLTRLWPSTKASQTAALHTNLLTFSRYHSSQTAWHGPWDSWAEYRGSDER